MSRGSWRATRRAWGWLVGLAVLSLAGAQSAAASEVYVANHGTDTISPFSIGTGGSLAPIACGASCEADSGPVGVVMSPDGRFLYAADYGSNSVSAFAIGPGGSPTPIPCTGCTTGLEPFGEAMSPSGRFLYTTDFSAGSLSAFSVAADGSLAAIACASCATGSGPTGVAVTPNGRFLYAANRGSGTVSAFSIGAGGALTPVACTTSCGAGASPEGVAVTPNGQFLYVADSGSGSVSAFSIAATGSLTPIACPGADCSTGSAPESLAISPGGQFLYVANFGASTVSAFAIGTGGSLTPIACPGTDCDTGSYPEGVAVSPSGQLLYTVNHAGSMSGFVVAASGALTPITCASCNIPAGADFQALTIAPDQSPVASFTATPAPAGERSSFDAAASTAAPGQSVDRYDWSFGDGSSAANGGSSHSHTYRTAGTYTVRLTVTDDAGCSTEQTFTGQTDSCNGSPAASKTDHITVPSGLVLGHVRESATRWREAQDPASKVPVGSTVSFTLSEPATVTFRFIREPTGRTAGTLAFAARRGTRKLYLTGRLSRSSELVPGRYALLISARTASGQRATAPSLSFTIVG